jgi:DNA segregation ATPase FtsK/SpoIIIE-like protein
MVQRRVRVGYAKAARLLDDLAETGVVMPPDGKGRYAVPSIPQSATETARGNQ